jgi:hypothetical protein
MAVSGERFAKYPRGKALIDEYKRRYSFTTLQSFSCGKDSI